MQVHITIAINCIAISLLLNIVQLLLFGFDGKEVKLLFQFEGFQDEVVSLSFSYEGKYPFPLISLIGSIDHRMISLNSN